MCLRVEVFTVLIVSHLAGDFILQTNWQALHKHGGCGRDPVARRALAAHIASYTFCFIPCFIWLYSDLGAWVIGVAALVAIPHAIQDDGRLLAIWVRRVKKIEPDPGPLMMAIDQSFHAVMLLGLALLAGN